MGLDFTSSFFLLDAGGVGGVRGSYGPLGQVQPAVRCLCKQIALKHSQAHLFTHCPWLLSSCGVEQLLQRPYVPWRLQCLLLALYRVNLLTSSIDLQYISTRDTEVRVVVKCLVNHWGASFLKPMPGIWWNYHLPASSWESHTDKRCQSKNPWMHIQRLYSIIYELCGGGGISGASISAFSWEFPQWKKNQNFFPAMGIWLQSQCFGLPTGDRLHFTSLESLCLFRDVMPNLITRVQSWKCGQEDKKIFRYMGKTESFEAERENYNKKCWRDRH